MSDRFLTGKKDTQFIPENIVELFDNNGHPKALTFCQPFASLCVLIRTWGDGRAVAEKEYDTRSFGCGWARNPKPQSIYIHASQDIPRWARNRVEQSSHFKRVLAAHGYDSIDDLPLGAIIGRVNILGSLKTDAIRDRLSEQERAFGIYDDGRLAIRLSDPEPFRQIVHCKGALGLWSVPFEIETRLRTDELANCKQESATA